MIRPAFITNEIYHIYNRGVEKRVIFQRKTDYLRFINSMREFNSVDASRNLGYYFRGAKSGKMPNFDSDMPMNNPLVEILCFCLMNNHYHFLVKQVRDNGVTEFMRKIGTGYTNYFNLKYDRVGPLFQGKFKAVHIKKDSQLLYIPHYIHLNPLDFIAPEWKIGKLADADKAIAFLGSYKWSSYPDYVGQINFPSVTSRNFILNLYRSPTSINYQREIKEWLMGADTDSIGNVVIEK